MKKLVSIISIAAVVLTSAAAISPLAYAEETYEETAYATATYADAEYEADSLNEAENYYSMNAADEAAADSIQAAESADSYDAKNAMVSETNESGNDDIIVFEDNKPVARMYLCVGGIRVPYFFGHAWICIENISDEPITIDGVTIQPGETVSTGLRSGSGGSKVGKNWNCEMKDYRGCKISAVSTEVTSAQLKTAENEIENSKWSWYELFTHNCTNYATSVWAAVTGKRYFAFCFPFVVRGQFSSSEVVQVNI